MISVTALSIFSTIVLLMPPGPVALLLDLMELPESAKLTLFIAVILNAVLCLLLERLALLARIVGAVSRRTKKRRRTVRENGKVYKAIQANMSK